MDRPERLGILCYDVAKRKGHLKPLKFSHSTWTTFWGTPQNGLY